MILTKQIDPKYSIRVDTESGVIEIVNMTGVPIPDDEPLCLFRARDYLAAHGALHPYMALAIKDGCTDFHLRGIANRIHAFEQFAKEHPERMKQPGVTRGM